MFFKKFFTIALLFQTALIAKPSLVAYYTNWSQYRTAPASFKPANLSPIISKLTDINYAFFFFNYQSAEAPAGVTNDWKIHFAEWNDDANVKAVVEMAKPHGTKVFASVGGWNFNTNDSGIYGHLTYTFFSQMVADPSKYMPFTASCIELCQKYGLAGIDLDWEFPGQIERGGSANDYQNYANFMVYFSTQLHAVNLKVTAAIPAFAPSGYANGTATINGSAYVISTSNPQSYTDWLSGLSQYFDAYNLMSYDYNGAWPGVAVTGENSPLFPLKTGAACTMDSVDNLLKNSQFPLEGTPPAKIIVGIGTYGRTFAGVTFPSPLPDQPFGPGAPFTQAGIPGMYTAQAGMLSYYEILGNLQTSFYVGTAVNKITATAYAWGTNQKVWVSYDNVDAVSAKSQFIVKNKLGGGMIYALDFDNFFDANTPYALTNALAKGLGR